MYGSAQRAASQRGRRGPVKRGRNGKFIGPSVPRFARRTSLAKTAGSYTGSLLQSMPVTGFPEMLKVRLRYSQFQEVTTGGGGQYIQQYKINSVFDPDLTSTGHQPMYRDQLYLIYKYAVVTECKWQADISTTSTSGHLINVQATTFATTDSDTSANVERGQTHQAFLQLGAPARLTGTVAINQLFGLTPPQLLVDDLYRHDSGTDPNQLAYLSLYMQNSALAPSTCCFNVVLDMTVVFKEVVKIAQS